MACLSSGGISPVCRLRFTIFVIAGRRDDMHCFINVVGRGSRIHVDDERDLTVDKIWSSETGRKSQNVSGDCWFVSMNRSSYTDWSSSVRMRSILSLKKKANWFASSLSEVRSGRDVPSVGEVSLSTTWNSWRWSAFSIFPWKYLLFMERRRSVYIRHFSEYLSLSIWRASGFVDLLSCCLRYQLHCMKYVTWDI